MNQARAIANPNIALIKYWGNRDDALRLPSNGSISFSLEGLETITQVHFDPQSGSDQLTLNQRPATEAELTRVSHHLDLVRELAQIDTPAIVASSNNFPAGAGIASSASAFAALTLAATSAAGLELSPEELSRLARRGSGSAARSIHPGFVEWFAGHNDQESFAETLFPPEHWNLVDLIAVVNREHKQVGSSQGHPLASTSPLQPCRVEDAPRRLKICRQAIRDKDFDALADIVEQDSNLMHAVMMTSTPQLFYWDPASISLMKAIRAWRKEGLAACFTLDAGPNVHCLTTEMDADKIETRLHDHSAVQQVIRARPGSGARLVDEPTQ
jgi:diphosphomevalonate decarboxylase